MSKESKQEKTLKSGQKAKIKKYVVIILLACIVAGAYLGYRQVKEYNNRPKVSLVQAEPASFNRTLNLTAKVEAKSSQIVSSDWGLEIEEVLVQEGDQVKQGDPLFRYSSRDVRQQLRKSKDELKKIEEDEEARLQSYQEALLEVAHSLGQEVGMSLPSAESILGSLLPAGVKDWSELAKQSLASGKIPDILNSLDETLNSSQTLIDEMSGLVFQVSNSGITELSAANLYQLLVQNHALYQQLSSILDTANKLLQNSGGLSAEDRKRLEEIRDQALKQMENLEKLKEMLDQLVNGGLPDIPWPLDPDLNPDQPGDETDKKPGDNNQNPDIPPSDPSTDNPAGEENPPDQEQPAEPGPAGDQEQHPDPLPPENPPDQGDPNSDQGDPNPDQAENANPAELPAPGQEPDLEPLQPADQNSEPADSPQAREGEFLWAIQLTNPGPAYLNSLALASHPLPLAKNPAAAGETDGDSPDPAMLLALLQMSQGQGQNKKADLQNRIAGLQDILDKKAYTVKAEIDGLVASLPITKGDRPEPGNLEALVLDNETLEATCRVGKSDAGRLQVGQKVHFIYEDLDLYGEVTYKSAIATDESKLGNLGELSADLGLAGQLGSLASGISGNDPKVLIRMSLEGPDLQRLTIGFDITCEVEVARVDNVLSIPVEALLQDRDQYQVYYLDEENVIHVQPIEIGLIGEDLVEVKSGLDEGGEVVFNALSGLVPGQKVKLLESGDHE